MSIIYIIIFWVILHKNNIMYAIFIYVYPLVDNFPKREIMTELPLYLIILFILSNRYISFSFLLLETTFLPSFDGIAIVRVSYFRYFYFHPINIYSDHYLIININIQNVCF